jgi:prepilin-type N-terminal cleavage/methylation domain-containing protein
MKLLANHSSRRPPVRLTTVRAFTLTEMMITMAVFALVVIAMVSLQIFGFKINSLTQNKLRSTKDSLNALDQIRNQIRGATNEVMIGSFNTSNNKFTPIANNSPAVGSAVLITNNTANFVVFFVNTNAVGTSAFTTNTFTLCEYGANNPAVVNGQLTTLAHSLVNLQPFQAEDYKGNTILVGSSGHYTIKMTLQFSNLVYSIPTPTYDTYRLESRATPREQFDSN